MKLALETVLLRMEKSPKRILSTFTNGCSMFKSVKMVSFLLVIFQHQFYVYMFDITWTLNIVFDMIIFSRCYVLDNG